MCAGEWLVTDGRLVAITPKSGHSRPQSADFARARRMLHDQGVLMDRVYAAPTAFADGSKIRWSWAKDVITAQGDAPARPPLDVKFQRVQGRRQKDNI